MGPATLVRHHGVDMGGRGTVVCPPFEGSAVLLRGCCTSAVREWVAHGRGGDPRFTAKCRIVMGMATPGELTEQRRDMIPGVSEARRDVDSSLT
jgi:hypothetical protein